MSGFLPSQNQNEFRKRLKGHLQKLYGTDSAARCLEEITGLAAQHKKSGGRKKRKLWDERDILLIAYGDQVQEEGKPPLQTLKEFLLTTGLSNSIDSVHLLPFFPFSSDDGFSVIDYKKVDPKLGSWKQVQSLGSQFSLMFDFVLNHVSAESDWFKGYLERQEPYKRFFIEEEPSTDLSRVVRPRNLPLLTPVDARTGKKHVWTTFSADQIDLNYKNYRVLVAMLDVLLFYVSKGARFIRMDAIAYLWKEVGTSCIHLKQTHTVVKLIRELLEYVAPKTVLLTETNVPHEKNVSYFGSGDEAHMVYQFSLPPLLLEALLSGETGALTNWAKVVCDTPAGTTFLNFTASHDGIGVRPLRGLVDEKRLKKLISSVKNRGGLVSTKRNRDGSESAYELNITYFDALRDFNYPQYHVSRFLLSQAIALSLRGIPGIYFHSLFGAENDTQGVRRSGQNRAINRKKFVKDKLLKELRSRGSKALAVFEAYRRMLEIRVKQKAFHPDAFQEIIDTRVSGVFAFRRTSLNGKESILVISNFKSKPQSLDLKRWVKGEGGDLLSGERLKTGKLLLAPFQVRWVQ